MGFRERVESDPIWWSLTLLVVGFAAGIGAYQTGLAISGYEPLPKGSVAKNEIGKSYLTKEEVDAHYFSKECARADGYPKGNWLLAGAIVEGGDHPPFGKQIYFLTPTGGTWWEGLGKAERGKYPKIVEAPFTVSSPPSAGGALELTLKHATFTPDDLRIATKIDLNYESKGRVTVSPDGCKMTGLITGLADVGGTVDYCWQPAIDKGLCAIQRKPQTGSKP